MSDSLYEFFHLSYVNGGLSLDQFDKWVTLHKFLSKSNIVEDEVITLNFVYWQ